MENDVPATMEAREKFYRCFRPMSSCMCSHVRTIKTETKFVILMHPKEFKKIKNGTGHLTHLSLENSELHIGKSFSEHKRENELVDDSRSNCYLLNPSKKVRCVNRYLLNRFVKDPASGSKGSR